MVTLKMPCLDGLMANHHVKVLSDSEKHLRLYLEVAI